MRGAPPVCLVVLDGWGLAPPGPGNAIELADTPVFDALMRDYPHTTLTAGGLAVGLPDGQMGNSEVGHLNLGAGSVIKQDLTRIDEAVADGTLGENELLIEALTGARRVHLIGLTSDGGIHSGPKHLEALIRIAGQHGGADLVLHAFTDGRDTSPTSGAPFLERVEGWMAEAGTGRIGSVIGRFFAMDRDKRTERIEKARALLMDGTAEHEADSGPDALRAAYERGETDEFVTPTRVGEEALIDPEQDSVIAFNFRPDRMREITEALAEASGVERYACMTEFEEGWPYPVLFPPARPATTLTEQVAAHGLRQLHVAETEKYPHVTYFFGGGAEEPAPGEERRLVASPRDVATYDEKPEMSAGPAADAFVGEWQGGGYGFGIINFANADMVGHTGVIPAAVRAVETVDAALGRVLAAVRETGGTALVTADHGNADEMLEEDGSPDTAHSLNPVPLIVTDAEVTLRDGGVLADVAPTVLQLLQIDQPAEMTGRSLIA